MRFPHFTVQIKLLRLEAGREDRCLLILRHFSGQCCQFHELEGTVHSLLDAWLSLRTAGTLPEYIKHFFLFLFSSASPFFCVLFSSFGWFSGYFPSAGIVPPTSALTLPSLLSHMSHGRLSHRGATVLGNQRASQALCEVIRQCCKCQLRCQPKAGPPFISPV